MSVSRSYHLGKKNKKNCLHSDEITLEVMLRWQSTNIKGKSDGYIGYSVIVKLLFSLDVQKNCH